MLLIHLSYVNVMFHHIYFIRIILLTPPIAFTCHTSNTVNDLFVIVVCFRDIVNQVKKQNVAFVLCFSGGLWYNRTGRFL